MSRRSAQSGQALVGTLALMVLVFGLAGGIAFAAATLLEEQSSHRSAISRDLRVEDVVTAEVARVAGRGAVGGPCQSTQADSNLLPDGYTSRATCVRFDQVVAPTLGSIVLTWQAGCASAPVPATQGQNLWLFFNALAGSGITAWVDTSLSCSPTAYARGDCKFSGAAQIVQARVPCDISEIKRPMLHVVNQVSSPSAVRFSGNSAQAGQNRGAGDADGQGNVDSNGVGSIYELAGTTGLGRNQYEEAFVFVSRDGQTTQLLAEGSLG